MTDKATLRTRMSELRAAIPAGSRIEASAAIANHFADHPYLTYAASFAGYYAHRDELDVLPIFNRMSRFSKAMSLPITQPESRMLQFSKWAPGQPLITGAYGIKCPPEPYEFIMPEVILVPLLAFDSRGYRLGYGGGYYDTTITSLRNAEKAPLFFGVGFSRQEVEEIPTEPHDARLDGILTEQGVSMF